LFSDEVIQQLQAAREDEELRKLVRLNCDIFSKFKNLKVFPSLSIEQRLKQAESFVGFSLNLGTSQSSETGENFDWLWWLKFFEFSGSSDYEG
jgi:hypothetical protein